MATFKSYDAIVKEINKRTTMAIDDTCKELRIKLQETINNEFYSQYTPVRHIRQWRIIDACIHEMLNDSVGQVRIDKSLADYIDPTEDVFNNIAEGIHGSKSIAQTDGRFWEEFISYCDTNISTLFKKNLKKYGVPVK